MIAPDVLALMRCPHCLHDELLVGSERHPSLVCPACETNYPIVEGIPDMVPPSDSPEPGTYRTETLFNLVAGIYDAGAPLISLAAWRCSPLRWVDSENRALGRANGGVYLRAPIGTGLILDRVLAPYHDVTLIGVDRSWNMLRKAARRFAAIGHPIHLMRVDYARLPFRDGVIDSLQSFNGLQTFPRRVATLAEFRRSIKPGGHLSGSALTRNQEALADAVLDRFERAGIYPMLRTAEFLLNDLRSAAILDVHHETHGAVMFFSAELPSSGDEEA